ncbi:MAG: DUF4445 domain-containing protein [Clostridiales bacterium]|nr:DUF4445 domain-containing protein [Clostridiales bacterium]
MSERIMITVQTGNAGEEIYLLHDVKKTVLETLRESEIALPSLCSGMGTCGRCKVKFLGYAPFPTQTERGKIAPDKLREGYRLSCMAKPIKNCTIQALFAEEEKIKVLTESSIGRESSEPERYYEGLETGSSVIAADIGTTTIAMRLLDVSTGEVSDTYTCLNPQRSYGMDVVERIRAGSDGYAVQLQRLVQEAILKGMEHFIQTAHAKPKLMVIACNTAMGHLFMGYPTDTLGKSPFRPVNIGLTEFSFNGVRTVLMPGISAFVGGDIVAGLYACELYDSVKPWLFLDLGTNAEMVIGTGGRFLCTAAAAGPAFEGKGEGNTTGPERIGAIAHLLEAGLADETGLLKEPYFEAGIDADGIFVTQKDIRDIQMAKAAVRAGIHFLLKKSGISGYEPIERVYLAGGFGFYLDKEAAVRIGLIPSELQGKLEVVGNTSLTGAGLAGRKILIDMTTEKRNLEDIIKNCEVFNLAVQQDFDKKYIEYLNF